MDSQQQSMKNRTTLYNRLWVLSGGILGALFSLSVVIERQWALFPQLGILEKIFNVAVVGFAGYEIFKLCPPSKRAFIGGIVFTLVLVAGTILSNGPNSPSPMDIIGLLAAGILGGVLVGTAWLGGLIGTLLMAVIVLGIAPMVRGSIGWGWIFIPMGAVGGSLFEVTFIKNKLHKRAMW